MRYLALLSLLLFCGCTVAVRDYRPAVVVQTVTVVDTVVVRDTLEPLSVQFVRAIPEMFPGLRYRGYRGEPGDTSVVLLVEVGGEWLEKRYVVNRWHMWELVE